jgi:hypothetical protein
VFQLRQNAAKRHARQQVRFGYLGPNRISFAASYKVRDSRLDVTFGVRTADTRQIKAAAQRFGSREVV